MNKRLKQINTNILNWIRAIGFNPGNFLKSFKGIVPFFADYIKIKKQLKGTVDFPCSLSYPVLLDRYGEGGLMKGHYFHQDLLVAKRIFQNNPDKHIDIGSRVDGFVAHVAVFREITIMDIRRINSTSDNIRFIQADLMNLPEEMVNSSNSISSLHAIEHFGLGRYSDPIDINGHIKALNNIHMMLKSQGVFYFSVPIGKQRIEFNAHRVFSIAYLLKLFEDKFTVERFSFVDDDGALSENIELSAEMIKNDCYCHYGCGIFELTKK
jgi:SAM-dependent methyltransferase